MKKLKVGIVGCGGIANYGHFPSYEEMPDLVEMVACADIKIERAQKAAEEYHIPHYYGSVEEMLAAEPDLDFIDCCTWTAAHAPVVIAAAKAGKNILCEKPLAASLEQGLAMEKAVKEAGVEFMLAVCTRYGNQEQKYIELRDGGTFGDIYFAKVSYIRRRGVPGSWFTNKELAGGGPVLDIGVHGIDRTWYLMGKPKPLTVSAETSYRIGRYEGKNDFVWNSADSTDQVFNVEDSASMYFRFEGGKAMYAEASWTINGRSVNGSTIYGTKAGCTFGPLTVYYTDEKGENHDDVIQVEENNIFLDEIRHYVGCLLEGKHPISGIDDAVTVQRMLDGIYRSAEEHREVSI